MTSIAYTKNFQTILAMATGNHTSTATLMPRKAPLRDFDTIKRMEILKDKLRVLKGQLQALTVDLDIHQAELDNTETDLELLERKIKGGDRV